MHPTNRIQLLLLLFLLGGLGETLYGQADSLPEPRLELEPVLYLLNDDSVRFQGRKFGIDFLENELVNYQLEIPECRKEDVRIKLFVLPKVSLNTVTQVKLTLKTNSFLKVVYQIPPNEKGRG